MVTPKKPPSSPQSKYLQHAEDTSQAFNIKPEPREGTLAEIPGITRLLKRKSLSQVRQKPSPDAPPIPEDDARPELTMDSFIFEAPLEEVAAPPTPKKNTLADPAHDGTQIVLNASDLLQSADHAASLTLNLTNFENSLQGNKGAPAKVSTHTGSKILPARRSKAPMQALAIWESSTLKGSSDTIAKLLLGIPPSIMAGAVFLTAKQENGSLVFLSTAAFNPLERLEIWTGLVWDPKIVAELWNLFVQRGHVELTPPGVNTLITSNRNVTRAVFGVEPNEYLNLFQIGPKKQFRGLLAVISTQSLESKAPALTNLVTASP